MRWKMLDRNNGSRHWRKKNAKKLGNLKIAIEATKN